MLDRVSTVVVGLDGLGGAERFADCPKWESCEGQQTALAASKSAEGNQRPHSAGDETPRATAKKKLSYVEAREFAPIEDRIHEAERNLEARRAALENPAVTSDRISLEN